MSQHEDAIHVSGAPEGQETAGTRRGPQVAGLVWAVVLLLAGATVMAAGLGMRIDLQLLLIAGLAGAGVTLMIAALRRR